MFVLGLDIGYSNLKMEYGIKGGEGVSKVMPAGAAKLDKLARNTMGSFVDDFLQVTVDGEQWAAGVEPGRL